MGEDHNEPNGGAGTDPAVLRLASRALALTAGVMLFAMMLVTTVDVVGRYGFASPLPGASEISQILLGLLIYFALPAVCLHQDHVIVGLVVERLAPGPRRVLGVLVNLLGGALLVVVAAQLHAHGALLAAFCGRHRVLADPDWPAGLCHGGTERRERVLPALQFLGDRDRPQVPLGCSCRRRGGGTLRAELREMTVWLVGLVALVVLMVAGLPIAFAMAAVGLGGIAYVIGLTPALSLLGQTFFDTGMSYSLTVMPLFVLMGNLVARAGLADELYAASNAWLRHLRGGLAMATVVACGGFSSVCGSSLATAATMAKVAMPSMRRYGYSDGLATGSIAAGGTLGILIPPSIILVLYGIMTQTDIGKLFLAGLLPGAIGVLGYMLAVRLSLLWTGEQAAVETPLPYAERWRALRGVTGVLSLFALVIGGIYVGLFTATEAAGVGAFGAFVVALVRRQISFAILHDVLLDTARMSALMFTILFGAILFSNFVNIAGLPAQLSALIANAGLPPLGVVLLILAIYFVLGMFLESLSMVLLTIPTSIPSCSRWASISSGSASSS